MKQFFVIFKSSELRVGRKNTNEIFDATSEVESLTNNGASISGNSREKLCLKSLWKSKQKKKKKISKT